MGGKDDAGTRLRDLKALAALVTPTEWLAIAPMLDALRKPIKTDVDPKTDIVTEAFSDTFATSLKLFHATHDPGEVLTKKGFEFAFKRASEAARRAATIVDSATHPGKDVIVEGVGFSLKTEASAGISRAQITISKLMESAWTKECTTAREFHAELHRIVSHLAQYDRILVLRTFGRLSKDGKVEYTIVEIPRSLLMEIEKAEESGFSAITDAGGTSLPIIKGGKRLFTVVFDGSDQKITIRNLPTSLCQTHGSWTLEAN